VLSTKRGLPPGTHTACRSSFQHPPHHPDIKRTDWVKFRTQLGDQISSDPEFHNEMAIETCDENPFDVVLTALAASLPKRRPRDDQRPLIGTDIQDDRRLKNRLRRQGQFTRHPSLKTEVKRLHKSATRRLNEWRNDQWSATLEYLDPEDQSLWMTKRVMKVSTPSPLLTPGNCSLRLWKSRSPCRQSPDSFSAGNRSFGPGSYRDFWSSAVVLLYDPWQRNQFNQPWEASGSH